MIVITVLHFNQAPSPIVQLFIQIFDLFSNFVIRQVARNISGFHRQFVHRRIDFFIDARSDAVRRGRSGNAVVLCKQCHDLIGIFGDRFLQLRLVEQHTPDRAARDFEAYLAALRDVEHVRPGPIGTVGYCMGGRLALRAAAQAPDDVAAVGMFHVGGLVTDDEDSAHLCIPHVRAEVLAGYADQDGSMPQEAIEKVAADMAAAGVRYSGAVYSGARHGFTMADTSVYDEAAAERHYEELQALFRRTLG